MTNDTFNKTIDDEVKDDMKTLKVALMQARVRYNPKLSYEENDRNNMNNALKLLNGLKPREVDIAVFPDNYPCKVTLDVENSPLPDEAKRLRAYIIAGELVTHKDNKYTATAIIDPDGKIVGRHYKQSLGESEKVVGLKACPRVYTFDIKGIKTGVMMSYDLNDHKLIEEFQRQDVKLIINPSEISPAFLNNWKSDLILRATLDGLNVIAINSGGHFYASDAGDGKTYCYGGGKSKILAPNPNVDLFSMSKPLNHKDFIKVELGSREEVKTYSLIIK